jgi:hypothetical protein
VDFRNNPLFFRLRCAGRAETWKVSIKAYARVGGVAPIAVLLFLFGTTIMLLMIPSNTYILDIAGPTSSDAVSDLPGSVPLRFSYL